MIRTIVGTARSSFRTRRELALENLALRHQSGVLTRALGERRPRFGSWDRALWVVLSRRWEAWRYTLAIVQPATVIRWHREWFKRFWTRKSRAGCGGRPALGREAGRPDPEDVEVKRDLGRSTHPSPDPGIHDVVYWNKKGWKRIGVTPLTTHKIFGPTARELHRYRVSAQNAEGLESQQMPELRTHAGLGLPSARTQ